MQRDATATMPQLPPVDYQPPPYTGPSREEVIAQRDEFCNPAIFTYYKEPMMIVDGHMQYLFDETGRRYLDMFAGIATISCGHCHPKVVSAIQEQTATLQHATTIYLHPNFGAMAEKLASKMPAGLNSTYFTNCGSEAINLAITMARLYTGNFDVIALQNSYHGGSPTAIGLTAHSAWKFPLPNGLGVHHAPCPDPYRSQFSGSPEEIAEKSAEAVRRIIQHETSGKVAAFICEPIQGVGGVTAGAANYLKLVYEIVREHGGVCIADEVQNGFGRTGDHYWGFENFDVVPDIVTMAKGIGNGVPLGAVTARRNIAEALAGKLHFNTYGGNPVCMAAGLAVLEVIDEDGLVENARVVGGYFKEGLRRMMDSRPIMGDLRGRGLMLGVELVRDRATREPATEETAQLIEEAREMGVLMGKCGFYGNVMRFKPPLCITREDADFALEVVDRALETVS